LGVTLALSLEAGGFGVKRVLTYGTYDLLHWGHIRLLKRARAKGDYLIVALSTDKFNRLEKNKQTYHDYKTRKKMLEAVRYVDLVIPEDSWDQKINDIRKYEVDIVVMGSDWKGSDHFDNLKHYCQLVYLPRTEGVSTTKIKRDLGPDKS
jgi:choline-phosphate cytidylyltransferase/glycerol-3-phosphate cytidylyltransferase